MDAVVIHAPKDLRIDEIADPPPPGPGQVLVRIAAGGICGSDLHYYHHGGFGVVRVQEPMALGHEIAGTVEALGSGVSHLAIGARVAVNPSLACGSCVHCRRGMRNQCLDMRFMGSAMRMPHVQGGFRQWLTVAAEQALPVASTLSLAEAAMAEPVAVCLHAGHQAGALLGRRVLVTGAGPIGCLCVIVAKLGGASEIVVTDVTDATLATASRVGATRTVNVRSGTDGLCDLKVDKGQIDVLFEASGNQSAVLAALDVMKPGGIMVQVGLGGEMTLPVNTIVAKELQLRGTFRFEPEFALAVDLMGKGLIDVKPMITATLPYQDAVDAFELASDRSRAMKVQLSF